MQKNKNESQDRMQKQQRAERDYCAWLAAQVAPARRCLPTSQSSAQRASVCMTLFTSSMLLRHSGHFHILYSAA